MNDRKARDEAAQLVRQLRDGGITNDQFVIPWTRTRDRAVKAVATMLWNLFSDSRVERFNADTPLEPAARELMDRCLLFLSTDLEYAWPQDDFIRISGVPPLLDALSFGRLNRRINNEAQREDAAMQAAGDLRTWPFVSSEQYEHARLSEASSVHAR